jgi:HlyD family secretion protein
MLDRPQRDRSTFVRFAEPLRSVEPATVLRKLRPLFDAVWRWRYRAPALLAVLASVWFFGIPFVFGPVVYVEPVVRAEFVHSVVASGHVEAPFRVNIGSQITGVVVDVPVEEGQSVKTGDILILLDDREARASVVQAEGAVAQAEARLRQLHELTLPSAEEALVQARATLLNAQSIYDRAAELTGKGVPRSMTPRGRSTSRERRCAVRSSRSSQTGRAVAIM